MEKVVEKSRTQAVLCAQNLNSTPMDSTLAIEPQRL